MKKLLFIFSFFFLFVLNGKTQEVEILTLEDCLRIGIDNNLSLEGKRKEIQKSNCKPRVWEIEKIFEEPFFKEKFLLNVNL